MIFVSLFLEDFSKICYLQRLRKVCILKYINYGWIILIRKLVYFARAFVPAVLLGEAEPKGDKKLHVLAGDFLLVRASVALASLRNTEIVELVSKVLEHLAPGEIMQLSSEAEDMSK